MDLLRCGARHYRQRSTETSTLLLQLFERYRLEVALMPDMLEQLARETIDELLNKMPAEERLKGLPAEERLKGLPAEERLKGLSAEERLKGMSLDALLAALPPEARAALAQRLRDADALSSSGDT